MKGLLYQWLTSIKNKLHRKTSPSFRHAEINEFTMEAARLQLARIETLSSHKYLKIPEYMGIESSESIVDVLWLIAIMSVFNPLLTVQFITMFF